MGERKTKRSKQLRVVAQDEAAALARLKAQPWITPGKGKPLRGLRKGITLRKKAPMAADLILQNRD